MVGHDRREINDCGFVVLSFELGQNHLCQVHGMHAVDHSHVIDVLILGVDPIKSLAKARIIEEETNIKFVKVWLQIFFIFREASNCRKVLHNNASLDFRILFLYFSFSILKLFTIAT